MRRLHGEGGGGGGARGPGAPPPTRGPGLSEAAPRPGTGAVARCFAERSGAGAERPPPGGGCAGRRGRAARGKRAANATWAPPERPERSGEERRGLAGSEAGRARGDGTGASEGLGLGSASGSRLGSLRPARGCPGEKLRDRRLPPRGSVLRLEQPLAPLLRSLPAPLGHSRAPGAARRGGGRPSVPVRGAAGGAALPSAPGCRCLPACLPRAARPDVPPAARSARPPGAALGCAAPPAGAAPAARRHLGAAAAPRRVRERVSPPRGVSGGNREQGAGPQPLLNAAEGPCGEAPTCPVVRGRGSSRLGFAAQPGASHDRGLLRGKRRIPANICAAHI